ncbi:MAG: extracellular solute-binding protein [bacterium]|nr:extracellular solute-binding protein [bacterium]
MQHRQEQRGSWSRLRAIALIAVSVVFLGAGCVRDAIPQEVAARLRPVNLVWWGVNETSDDVRPLIDAYRQIHPHVQITYRKLRLDEYETALLDALSEGDFAGPDIISIPATWTRRYQSKLLPAPSVVTMPFVTLTGTVRKEQVGELRATTTPNPQTLRDLFLDVVVSDVVLPREGGDAVYGLPLYVDTLVLYANRDLLNAGGIPVPAKTWAELQQQVPRLTRVAADGAILQSGVALGTMGNVPRSFDILSLLMMQNGTQMIARGVPSFHLLPAGITGRTSLPAADALAYYADFANPNKLVYSWNDDQPDALEAFLQGKVAYFFGYSYHRPIIRSRAPQLNLSVSAVPHIAAAVDPQTGSVIGSDVVPGGQGAAITYADFWLQAVSERTSAPNETWDFLTYITTQPQVTRRFLEQAKRPTALRSLVGEQQQDVDLKVFANQLLTARTWYHGKNAEGAEQAFVQLVRDAYSDTIEINRALQLAAQKIQQTL